MITIVFEVGVKICFATEFEGIKLTKIKKNLIFESLLKTFKVSSIFEASWPA
jgi:hypothetical protein